MDIIDKASHQSPAFIKNIKLLPHNTLLTIQENNFISLHPSFPPFDHPSQSLSFETNIYDALQISNSLMVSSKDMPLRIYNLQNLSQVSSINNKRKNSQSFLSVIQLSRSEGNEYIVGGGHKICCSLDLNKLTIKDDFKLYQQKHISAIKIQQPPICFIGEFDGTISTFDIRNQQLIHLSKVHMDAITSILLHPSNHLYLTSARKDDFKYLWDFRMPTNFVQCYREPLFNNQRVGIEFSLDGAFIFSGNQKGQLIAWQTMTAKQILRYNLNQSSKQQYIACYCVASICSISSDQVVCAVGGRNFARQKYSQDGSLKYLKFVVK